MKRWFVIAAVLCIGLIGGTAHAGNGTPINTGSANTLTLAVFGDWPYGDAVFKAAPLLIGSINADPKVRLVIHVGDIHSGSQPCTGAGLVPTPPTALPGYNDLIFGFFEQFKDPFVYTPGDNEWTDCHKAKQGKSGAPLNELAAVRALFFRARTTMACRGARPSRTRPRGCKKWPACSVWCWPRSFPNGCVSCTSTV